MPYGLTAPDGMAKIRLQEIFCLTKLDFHASLEMMTPTTLCAGVRTGASRRSKLKPPRFGQAELAPSLTP